MTINKRPSLKFNPADDLYKRNYGFWSEAEQEKIANAKVKLIGGGGDGFQLGQDLIQMGFRHLDIADPETFDRTNMNRVPYVAMEDIGKNKAAVFKKYALSKVEQPDSLDIRIFSDGATVDNIDDIMEDADIVIDESELTYPQVGTMVAREARKKQVPDLMVMNIGFAAIGTSFNPHSRHTFEKVMGLPEGAPLDEIEDMEVDYSRCLPYLPKYGDLTSLDAVKKGASFPGNKIGVNVAASIGEVEAFLHVTSGMKNNRKHPTWAPKWRWMDAYSGGGGVIRFPRVGYYRSILSAGALSLCGLNPKASYSLEEQEKRQARR